MVQLVEVVKNTRNYELREVFVNPRHVVMLREDHATRSAINEGKVIATIINLWNSFGQCNSVKMG